MDILKAWHETQKKNRNCYILRNLKLVKVTLKEWEVWFQNVENRIIDQTDIRYSEMVSTICVGIDINKNYELVNGVYRPGLFQTMIFGGKHGGESWTCPTVGESKRLHWEVVNSVRNNLEPTPKNGKRL